MWAVITASAYAELPSADPLVAARDYFDKSLEDEEFIEQARELFTADLKKNGHSPVTGIYLAALGCIEAKHSIWPIRRIRLANAALDKMAEIVRAHPNNLEVRLLFAATLGKLPLIFGRRDEAKRERQIAQALVHSPDATPVSREVLTRFTEILAEGE